LGIGRSGAAQQPRTPRQQEEQVTQSEPEVLRWYQRYCVVVSALWFAGGLAAIVPAVQAASIASERGFDPTAFALFAWLLVAVLLFMGLIHVAALRTIRAPGMWPIHAIVLGLDLTTLVLWPVALPLLVQWLKPATRAWYRALAPEVGDGR
jgi:hypothetical protein